MNTVEILRDLVAFDTTSRNSNRALMDHIARLLAEAGIAPRLVPDPTGTKLNLYATVGPADRGGVMLSGHTDVVPVDGQDWTRPAFEMTEAEGRLYGRGTTDMKGFVAAAIRAARAAAERDLTTPLHLAFSCDEEVGCLGVRTLIDLLDGAPVRPAMCIVGEPTAMQVATGHKGKVALRSTCTGREGHSALAPMALNAIHLACDLVAEIRALQADLAERGARDGDYDVPYTTLHVGKIGGGTALNIVPNRCTLDWEIRNIVEDDAAALLARIDAAARRIEAAARAHAPEAAIVTEQVFAYPGLGTPPGADVVAFVKALTGVNGTIKVAFGTEGGLFSQRLGIPTVVCGPGSMAQGHKPDEYVTRAQLDLCDAMLDRLLDRLAGGGGPG